MRRFLDWNKPKKNKSEQAGGVSRRSLLAISGGLLAATMSPRLAGAKNNSVRHILPTVTDTQFAISVSLSDPVSELNLAVNGIPHKGQRVDSKGRFWSFAVTGLDANTSYELHLTDGMNTIGESWPLKTFPHADAMPANFKLLAFTCAGGADGFEIGGRQLFKPHIFRQKLFDAALAKKPDAAVAIGDHVYWDLRGRGIPPVGRRRSAFFRFFAGMYVRLRYGEFDRSKPLIGTANEDILIGLADEQVADLYGTRFKSTPIFFVSDDHDYFENDDAEEDIVTFPPDAFSRAAHKALADLYYPPLPDGPDTALNRSFGTLKYGALFEAPLFDCAGHLSLGEANAALVPHKIESWLTERAAASLARHLVYVPSHPFGWTAGKWREWYPDVVAPAGFTGVVTNELLGDVEGELTTDAQKYLWQKGWWEQHQRLLTALANRSSPRFILSGDIHAQGAVDIYASGALELKDNPIKSFLVGPVGTSEGTWPSVARGIEANAPQWMQTSPLSMTKEINGFAVFDFTPTSASAELFDCGGYHLANKEDGRVQETTSIKII